MIHVDDRQCIPNEARFKPNRRPWRGKAGFWREMRVDPNDQRSATVRSSCSSGSCSRIGPRSAGRLIAAVSMMRQTTSVIWRGWPSIWASPGPRNLARGLSCYCSTRTRMPKVPRLNQLMHLDHGDIGHPSVRIVHRLREPRMAANHLLHRAARATQGIGGKGQLAGMGPIAAIASAGVIRFRNGIRRV